MAGQFDMKKEQLHQEIGSFAGGYQMRIKIIAVLLDDPNLLLLDEPTNYLDLATLLLLEQFLQSYAGSFLLISHDREFLKRTCDQTLEIANGKATFYPQPLEEYLAYKIQQEEFAKRYNKKIATQQRHLQSFVDRFRYKASKASQAQSKLKQLNKLQQITIKNPIKTAAIHIPLVDDKKGTALTVTDLTIGYGDTTVADDIHLTIERGEHVAILGNNGQGKSTLLKTIAGVIPALSGYYTFGMHLRIGYYAQHVPDMLNPQDQIGTYLHHAAGPDVDDQDIFRMAGNFLFNDDDLKTSISVLSGGEKARLCLAGLLLQKNDVLLLDEPTNHLDFETVEALSEALAECNTTLLFVSHNRTFVNTIATSIIEVAHGTVKRSHHNYENYVYHLKEHLHIQRKEHSTENKKPNELKQQRVAVRDALKREQKELREVEMQIMELEKKKHALHEWFAENTTTFSRAKQDELTIVQRDLHLAEEAWLQAQEEVTKLEQERKKLEQK